jgi:alpha-1,2-mannosyltransferase
LWWPVLIGVLINFPPVLAHLSWGQTQLLLLLLLTACWRCLRRHQDERAGVLLGVAIALKLFPLLLILPLIISRRWRCSAIALVTAGSVLAFSFALVGWEQSFYYVTRVLPEVDYALSHVTSNTTSIGSVLRGALGRGPLAEWLGLAFRIGVVAAVAVGAIRMRDAADKAFNLGMTALVLASPVVWEHYFVLLYLPWLDQLARAPRRQQPLLALAYFLIATASLAYNVPEGWGFVAHALPIGGALLLLVCQLQHVFRPAVPHTAPEPGELQQSPLT